MSALLFEPWAWPIGGATLSLSLPAMLLLFPVPLLLARIRKPYESRFEALHAPFFEALARETGTPTRADGVILRISPPEVIVLGLCWFALLLAAARPIWTEAPLTRTLPRRDLLLAIDISQSMDTRDMQGRDGRMVERLASARRTIDEFITRRKGDRIGLVVFADGAHLLVPFTEDHALARELLAELRTGLAGPRTRIGDAIGLGVRLFAASDAPSRVMVLLTDGSDTGSRVPPVTAARIALERGVVVHTVALGKPGNTVDKVDTASLQAIASLTRGHFAVAASGDELNAVYRELDALEAGNQETLSHRPQRDVFHWPLGVAIVLLFAWQSARALRGRWLRWHPRSRSTGQMPRDA